MVSLTQLRTCAAIKRCVHKQTINVECCSYSLSIRAIFQNFAIYFVLTREMFLTVMIYQGKAGAPEFQVKSFLSWCTTGINAATKVIAVFQLSYRFLNAKHKFKVYYQIAFTKQDANIFMRKKPRIFLIVKTCSKLS